MVQYRFIFGEHPGRSCRNPIEMQPVSLSWQMESRHERCELSAIVFWMDNLLSPNFAGDFLYQTELVPLLRFGELVADFARGKAALRAQTQLLQG